MSIYNVFRPCKRRGFNFEPLFLLGWSGVGAAFGLALSAEKILGLGRSGAEGGWGGSWSSGK